MPCQYVILHHRVAGGEHWDLMLEYGEVLLTWQLSREPVDSASLPIPARRIKDHRKLYLDYKGPISGNRGTVTPIDAGSVEFVETSSNRYLLTLQGIRLQGRFVLHGSGAEWIFERFPIELENS